jgi:hypothetical protein
MEIMEIVVVSFCLVAVLAAPAWVVVRFARPIRRTR